MPVKSAKKQVKKAVGKKVQKAVKVTKKALQKGGKKAAAKKKAATKKAAPKKAATKKTTTVVVKKQRSFKVKLPNSEVYEGRFTGLTPYQAANKALSKYYREAKKTKKSKSKSEIVFSIRESTRGSKRLVYHYNGHREKLKVPVEYVIKSGDESRVITKNFKNRLTKIKKNELASLNLA